MKLLVVAGNARQGTDFAMRHDLSPRDWVYVHSAEQLVGLNADEVHIAKTGEWWDSKVSASPHLRVLESDVMRSISERVGKSVRKPPRTVLPFVLEAYRRWNNTPSAEAAVYDKLKKRWKAAK